MSVNPLPAGPPLHSALGKWWPAAAAAAVLLWVYGPTLTALWQRWGSDSRYSHGYLVPLFALYLLWSRRGRLASAAAWRPNWWGLSLVAGALVLNAVAALLYYDWLSALSLAPCLAGLAVLLGGWRALGWSWPAAAFLLYLAPLPHRLEIALSNPLQSLGTAASTYALQTLGFTAFAEGNVIRMGDVRLGVVEACSGLSMLMIFFTLSTAVAVLVRRPAWEKGLIVASAVPIALAANVTRITVTGILHKTAGHELANLVFHDLAGWLMMPLALLLLWAELRLLAWLVVKRPATQGAAAPLLGFGLAAGAASASRPSKEPSGGGARRAARARGS